MWKLGLALVLTVGCATTSNYDRNVKTWVGQPESRLVAQWGYPSNMMTAPSGNRLLLYSARGGRTPQQVMKTGPSTAMVVGGHEVWCDTYFEVDGAKTVVAYQWRGNGCRAK